MAERSLEPAVQNSSALDLTRIDPDARLVTALELDRVTTATAHEAQTVYRRRSRPGVWTSLALVIRYESQDINRWPRVQACVS